MQEKRFSRQLIVLRAVITGYSGHARVVQSGDSADIELRIQAPAGSAVLSAALVETTGGYRGCPLGDLTTDERGQAAGTFSLAGADASPDVLAIVQQDPDGCKLAMSGFLNGPKDVNWAQVRAAACDAVSAGVCTAAPPASSELPEAEENKDLFAGFGSVETNPFVPEAAEAAPDSAPSESTAAAEAGVSPDAVWPDEIAALQPLFECQPPVTAYSGSRYTFILVPATDDAPEYLAGLWCSHGIPTRAAYAVRAQDAYTPPQGLEDFLWRGCEGRGGFWVAYIDAATGEPIADDY